MAATRCAPGNFDSQLSGDENMRAPLSENVMSGLNRVRFPSPVPVGSRIRTGATLVSVETVADGSFQIRELPPGNYRLTVSRHGFVTKVLVMQVGSHADPQHVTMSRR